MKPTSRSVLRSSVAKNQEKQIVAQIKSAGSDCDIYLKRFSKNKDAMLAKRFHNFLNRYLTIFCLVEVLQILSLGLQYHKLQLGKRGSHESRKLNR